MAKKLRIAQYGCGTMSVYTMRYAIEKGADVVCAFARSPHTIGKDVGEIAGVGKTGVLVQDSKDAVTILEEQKPDACIIATASSMQDLKRPFMDCAEAGVNAITTGEEAFYPWNSSYKTTQLLDESARKNGCTLCGSGYQDVFWGNLITTLAGATHTIKRIVGKSSYKEEPNTEVIINRPATVELTCATIVNRIPDLIAAAPGFTTTEKIPTNAFRARDLSIYL